MSLENQRNWLRLALLPGIHFDELYRLLKAFGLPEDIFSQTVSSLMTVVPQALALEIKKGPSKEDEEKINEDRRMCKRRVSERASKVRARPSSVLFRGDRLRQQVHRAVDLRSDGRHGVYGAFEGEDRS